MGRGGVALMIVAGLALGIAAIGPSFSKGSVADNFQLYSTRGKLVQLSELRGKVVVLDFWASWCPPCRAAIPAMQRLHDRYAEQGVVVLGINVRDNKDPAEFMQKMGANYRTLIDGEEVADAYRVKGIPTIIVIDPAGKVVHRESGWGPGMESKMREVIEAALEHVAL